MHFVFKKQLEINRNKNKKNISFFISYTFEVDVGKRTSVVSFHNLRLMTNLHVSKLMHIRSQVRVFVCLKPLRYACVCSQEKSLIVKITFTSVTSYPRPSKVSVTFSSWAVSKTCDTLYWASKSKRVSSSQHSTFNNLQKDTLTW